MASKKLSKTQSIFEFLKLFTRNEDVTYNRD